MLEAPTPAASESPRARYTIGVDVAASEGGPVVTSVSARAIAKSARILFLPPLPTSAEGRSIERQRAVSTLVVAPPSIHETAASGAPSATATSGHAESHGRADAIAQYCVARRPTCWSASTAADGTGAVITSRAASAAPNAIAKASPIASGDRMRKRVRSSASAPATTSGAKAGGGQPSERSATNVTRFRNE